MTFTTHIRSNLDVHKDGDTSDDELSDDALAEACNILYLKWNKECKSSEKKKEKFEVSSLRQISPHG